MTTFFHQRSSARVRTPLAKCLTSPRGEKGSGNPFWLRKARLGGLTTALYLIQFEDDRRRRAKAEVEPVPEGSAVVRIRAAAPRLLDPLDRRLVSRDETGLVDEEAAGPGFSAIEFTRSAAALVAQNIRHMRDLRPHKLPTMPTLDEHAKISSIVKPVLCAKNKAKQKFCPSARLRPGTLFAQRSQRRRSHPKPWRGPTYPWM